MMSVAHMIGENIVLRCVIRADTTYKLNNYDSSISTLELDTVIYVDTVHNKKIIFPSYNNQIQKLF